MYLLVTAEELMSSVSLNLNYYFRKNNLYSKKPGQVSVSTDPGSILTHEKLLTLGGDRFPDTDGKITLSK